MGKSLSTRIGQKQATDLKWLRDAHFLRGGNKEITMTNEKNIDPQTDKELQNKYHEILAHVKKEITPPQDQTKMFYAGHKDSCTEFVDRMNKRIDDHVKYVKELLDVHGEDEIGIKIVEFHYRTVAKHFIGHTLEDVAEMAEQHGAFEIEKKCRRILEEVRKNDIGVTIVEA